MVGSGSRLRQRYFDVIEIPSFPDCLDDRVQKCSFEDYFNLHDARLFDNPSMVRSPQCVNHLHRTCPDRTATQTHNELPAT
jgi:hypothetical protein